MNIVFVCTGNTCRSPMAAGIFNAMAPQAGLNASAVSCGLSAFVPGPATQEAIQVASEYGADISGHTSTQVSETIMASADQIFCMTKGHLDVLALMYPPYADRMHLLGHSDISDPFGGDVEEYAAAGRQIAAAVERLVARLLREVTDA